MRATDLRPATPSERESVVIPGLISARKHLKALNHQHRITMVAAFLVVTVAALFGCFYLHLSALKNLLLMVPFVALFGFASFRLDCQIKGWTYIVNTVQNGQFLVREIQTAYSDVYALITYVRHPKTAKLAIQAFAGGAISDSDRLLPEKEKALRHALRDYINGSVIELDIPEGGAF